MGKCAAGAYLDAGSVFSLTVNRLTQAVLIGIQRAIAKEAVKGLPLHPLMAWIIFAIFVFKKAFTGLHMHHSLIGIFQQRLQLRHVTAGIVGEAGIGKQLFHPFIGVDGVLIILHLAIGLCQVV